eukprot:TRINITY_DN73494_c0_g1_i1.p1 TRINITY_DN73494_c0_g1~~TRINITY_DN73494_c0_g1_i1.p1  ORF type:complete len:145 (+),score=30.39 TRINITY_DN73494_c0_g1_i1:91-525(+)
MGAEASVVECASDGCGIDRPEDARLGFVHNGDWYCCRSCYNKFEGTGRHDDSCPRKRTAGGRAVRQKITAEKRDNLEEKMLAIFKREDDDGNRKLDINEFKDVARRIAPDANDAKVRKLFARCDRDGSGAVDVQEFLAWVLKGR